MLDDVEGKEIVEAKYEDESVKLLLSNGETLELYATIFGSVDYNLK